MVSMPFKTFLPQGAELGPHGAFIVYSLWEQHVADSLRAKLMGCGRFDDRACALINDQINAWLPDLARDLAAASWRTMLVRSEVVHPITGQRMSLRWESGCFNFGACQAVCWDCTEIEPVRVPRWTFPLFEALTDEVLGICDALEWLLTPWGHRHVGRVSLSREAVESVSCDRRVWWNRSAGFEGPLATLWEGITVRVPLAPEAEIRTVLTHRPLSAARAELTVGGSQEWVFSSTIGTLTRVARALSAHDLALYEIGAAGVVLLSLRGPHDHLTRGGR